MPSILEVAHNVTEHMFRSRPFSILKPDVFLVWLDWNGDPDDMRVGLPAMQEDVVGCGNSLVEENGRKADILITSTPVHFVSGEDGALCRIAVPNAEDSFFFLKYKGLLSIQRENGASPADLVEDADHVEEHLLKPFNVYRELWLANG